MTNNLARDLDLELSPAGAGAADTATRGSDSGFFYADSDAFCIEELTPLDASAVTVMDAASAWRAFVAAMREVARERGHAANFQSVLDAVHTAKGPGRGWVAILRGESEDLRLASGVLLDEWAAEVLTTATGDADGVLAVRRALRARGVCAFGILEADAAR
jgi:hypothetical protein